MLECPSVHPQVTGQMSYATNTKESYAAMPAGGRPPRAVWNEPQHVLLSKKTEQKLSVKDCI